MMATAKRAVYVAAVGDAGDPSTFSGIPFYFSLEAKRQGLVDEALALDALSRSQSLSRCLWNIWQISQLQEYGGFQYSPFFLERLWKPARSRVRGAVVINCFQLYPPSIVADPSVEKWYFIDMTLRQLFEEYGVGRHIGERVQIEALRREALGYRSAAGIIAHSQWAEQSLVRHYGVAESRIHVVCPGASFEEESYSKWERRRLRESPRMRAGRPLRLAFVGKDWRRKGLDRLLRALKLARSRGLDASLRVIGVRCSDVPAHFRDMSGIEWIGFLDKRHELRQFLDLVGDCEVGCLLSTAEAGGVALREFHALGLVVLCTNVGGSPEHTIDGANRIVPRGARDEDIARALLELGQDEGEWSRISSEAWRVRKEALWSHSVEEIMRFWPHNSQMPAP